jgi:hypothetical protein
MEDKSAIMNAIMIFVEGYLDDCVLFLERKNKRSNLLFLSMCLLLSIFRYIMVL